MSPGLNFRTRVPAGCVAVIETSRNLLVTRLATYRIVPTGQQYGRTESVRGSAGIHVLQPNTAIVVYKQGIFTEASYRIVNYSGWASTVKLALRWRRPSLQALVSCRPRKLLFGGYDPE